MGRRLRVISPTITVRMAMTIATMGRRMKKSAITVIPWRAWPRRLCGFGLFGGLGHSFLRPSSACTGAPSRTFCKPSTTMRSPGLSPSRIRRFSPICSPTLTARCVALLSEPMTHTKVLALQFRDRAFRDQNAVGAGAEVHSDPPEHPGSKQLSPYSETRRARATCRSSHPPRDR